MLSQIKKLFGVKESGLLVVILALGALLSAFSGTVRLPVFETGPDGVRQRVFVTNEAGERVPAIAEKNKFLNAQNLAQLAKDTSFIAIMAVGMSLVIIAGGIDLSVGSIYALASVLGALVFQYYGSDGAGANAPPGVGVGLAQVRVALHADQHQRHNDERFAIERDHGVAPREEVTDQVDPEEPGAAGDEPLHGRPSSTG